MAEKKEEKEEKAEGEAEAPKKSKKKLIIIVAVVLILAGGGGFFALSGGKEPAEGEGEHAAEHAAEEEDHYEMVDLDTFIVNLSENASFLKVKIEIEVNSHLIHNKAAEGEAGGGGGGHGGEAKGGSSLPGVLGTRQPMIRDSIIKVISSKKAEELLGIEGKDTLKEELVDAINEATGLSDPVVSSVYFTDFIIQ